MKQQKKSKQPQLGEVEISEKHVQHPTAEEIRHRAHQIFLARGGKAGREFDDWLQAEREIKTGKVPPTNI